MSGIKAFLVDLVEDLATVEVATFSADGEAGGVLKIAAYTHMEVGGDAIHFFDRTAYAAGSLLPELHLELLLTAAGSRSALREIISTALK